MKSVGIVIPAYNESKNIIKLLKTIKKKINCLIVIVDDSPNLKTQKINRAKKGMEKALIILRTSHLYLTNGLNLQLTGVLRIERLNDSYRFI